MTRGRRWTARALILAGFGAVGTATVAATPPVSQTAVTAGSLTVTPAILEASATPNTGLSPIDVKNGTTIPFHIRIYPALVEQDLDGSLVLRKPSPGRARAPLPFALRPQNVTLRPGNEVSIAVVFNRRAPGLLGAQAAAVIEATPPRTSRSGSTYRLRVLAALLVRLPNATQARGRFIAVHARSFGARHLQLCARIGNSGRVYGYSRDLIVRIRNARGRPVFSASPRSSFVLAGFRRDFCVNAPPHLPAGRYWLEANGFFGNVRMRGISKRFHWDPRRAVGGR